MNHSRAVVRLVDLEEGRLEGEERQWILAHAGTCSACREWLATYRELVVALRESPGAEREAGIGAREHPSSGDLARFVVSPETLDEAEWLAIERHVEDCVPCAEDADRLARVLETTAAPSAGTSPWPGSEPKPGGLRFRIRRSAPLAAALALAVLLPAAFLVGRSSSSDSAPSGPIDVPLLQDALRSGGGPEIVRVHPEREDVVLGMIPPLPRSFAEKHPDAPITLRVERADGEPVWTGSMDSGELSRRLADRGVLFVSLPSERIPPGAYRLRIDAPPPAGRLLDTPFRVAPTPR